MNQIGHINKIRQLQQCMMKCYSTPECNTTCIHEGYEEGKCLQNWLGGVECCCLASFRSQDGSPIPSMVLTE